VSGGTLSFTRSTAPTISSGVTVNGGVVNLGVNNAIGTGTNVTLGGGTLQLGGAFNQSLGTLTLTLDSAGSINFANSGGLISFASGGLSYTGSNHVTIDNYNFTDTSGTGGGSRLQFPGLSSNDLLHISINNFAAQYAGDNLTLIQGTLAPVPEPSTYAALAGVGVLGFAIYRRRQNRFAKTSAAAVGV
jgi:hypothetical protein